VTYSIPEHRLAGDREAGARCAHCNVPLARGEPIAACGRCGAVHHDACWQARDGCGSFDCAPNRRVLDRDCRAAVRITAEEVSAAVPLPSRRALPSSCFVAPPEAPRTRTSRMALAALIVALLGIPIFGAITGLVAVILGSLAIGAIHHTRQRGTWMAVTGVLLGLADVVGWLIFLGVAFSRPEALVNIGEFEPDLESIEHLSPRIARAVRANVLIETREGGLLGGNGVGSGVILRIDGDTALIATNRHVVDPHFAADEGQAGDGKRADNRLQVKLIGQMSQPGRVVWTAPDGIDLALVAVAVVGEGAEAAAWEADRELTVGDDVFTIGNPQQLGWSHTRGSISQLRLQHRGLHTIRIIQTDAALNPGNSGGGLYDKEGTLIGLNTWIRDKRFSEGLGFAIAFSSLLSLDPPPLRQRAERGPPDP
jgi:S1-C subfamily serine protease